MDNKTRLIIAVSSCSLECETLKSIGREVTVSDFMNMVNRNLEGLERWFPQISENESKE